MTSRVNQKDGTFYNPHPTPLLPHVLYTKPVTSCVVCNANFPSVKSIRFFFKFDCLSSWLISHPTFNHAVVLYNCVLSFLFVSRTYTSHLDFGKLAQLTTLKRLQLRAACGGLTLPSFAFSGGLEALSNLKDLTKLVTLSTQPVHVQAYWSFHRSPLFA